MSQRLHHMLNKLNEATRAEDLFGDLDAPREKALARRYRYLAGVVHPDRNIDEPYLAETAFKLLQEWHAEAERKLAEGSYGQALTLDIVTPHGVPLQSSEAPIKGDLCDLYRVKIGRNKLLFKLVRNGRNNDLLDAEKAALACIERKLGGKPAGYDPGPTIEPDPLRPHFPFLTNAFSIRDEAGVLRRANLIDEAAGVVSLADVLARYPEGIDAADAAWMFNRMLAALGKTHELGLVHGAVLPEHFLIRPKDHNGMLIDWCYSVEAGDSIKAISPGRRAFYPSEVINKGKATAATDLYMAANCMVAILGGLRVDGVPALDALPASVPPAIVAMLRGCLLPSPHYRASDAWELFDEFREILSRLYGEPTFREFTM